MATSPSMTVAKIGHHLRLLKHFRMLGHTEVGLHVEKVLTSSITAFALAHCTQPKVLLMIATVRAPVITSWIISSCSTILDGQTHGRRWSYLKSKTTGCAPGR